MEDVLQLEKLMDTYVLHFNLTHYLNVPFKSMWST